MLRFAIAITMQRSVAPLLITGIDSVHPAKLPRRPPLLVLLYFKVFKNEFPSFCFLLRVHFIRC